MKKQAKNNQHSMEKNQNPKRLKQSVKPHPDDFKDYVEEITPLLFQKPLKSCTEYTMDPESHMLFPGPQQWKERLIHAMHKESNNPRMLHLNTFCRKYGFYQAHFYKWINNDPELLAVFEHFKLSIAENRRVGAMKFKLNYNAIKGGLEKLDPGEKESFEYHNNLKGQAMSQMGTHKIWPQNLPDLPVAPKPEEPHE